VRTFGKYRLVEPLASGGMADVWRAEVTGAEGVVKEVALKLVRGEHAERSDFVRMFVQEARLAARLSHANVVQVFEFDQVGGRYYIAMELVRGRHLGQVVERARERGLRLGVPRAVHVAAEVARALAYAHRLGDGGRPLGLVHRDVSPHNVLVSFEGEVKLADFGIARAMNLGELTDPGNVKGKLAYMAPEQARGAAVDARADVFSLGVVLWELCAGRRLFARDGDAATLAAVLETEPVSPPSAWNEEVPAELDAVALGALERDPERRTRSAQELAAALSGVLLRVARAPEDVDLRAFVQRLFPDEAERAASGAPAMEPTAVRPVPVAREPVAEPSLARALEVEESETRTAASTVRAGTRRRVLVAAGLVGAAAVAAGVVVAATRAPTPPASATASSNPKATPNPTSNPTPNPTSTSTSTPTPNPTPNPNPTSTSAAAAAAAAAESAPADRSNAPQPQPQPQTALAEAPSRRPRPLESSPVPGRLAMPRRASGEGLLLVHAVPWGTVHVNGVELGEAPQEVRLPAGRHRVRITRPNQRAVDADVTVEPGRRTKLLR
jgi:serine/threonine-protein kinase